MNPKISIVMPAKNEEDGLANLLMAVKSCQPDAELIVVNDGSEDQTGEIAGSIADIVVDHPYSMGNGAAIKSGARLASGDVIVFLDSDGQHSPDDIDLLLDKLGEGFDMVIGARDSDSHANVYRRFANSVFNKLASMLTGRKILDLTSGFRAVSADKFRQFLYLLPNGFSYPTTITMAFLRSGYPLTYFPIKAKNRTGESKINPIKDGLKFFLIILRIGSLYSPLRLFIPISLSVFLLGLGYYTYTFITMGRLTNMSAILFISSLLIFLIGIVAEQISSLHYLTSNRNAPPANPRTTNEQ